MASTGIGTIVDVDESGTRKCYEKENAFWGDERIKDRLSQWYLWEMQLKLSGRTLMMGIWSSEKNMVLRDTDMEPSRSDG